MAAELQATDLHKAKPEIWLNDLLSKQRKALRQAGTPDYKKRIDALKALKKGLLDHQDEWVAAVSADFGNRSAHETVLAEIFVVVSEIDDAIKHLRSWMKPTIERAVWQYAPAVTKILYQPKGVVGVIGAWNYPIQLNLGPVVGAVAAGNHVMVKPSELAPKTAALMEDIISHSFPTSYVTVCNGDVDVSAAFSSLAFDHICFTGSTRVGKIIMRNAAENLVPVTLELGGKSPAIVGTDAISKMAAARIARGKFLNAGQTCVAPDYVLVHEAMRDQLVADLRDKVAQAYGNVAENDDYTHIVCEPHYQRHKDLVADAQEKGATIISACGGESVPDDARRMFPPTLILNPTDDMRVMQEEIFGPLLPIKTYNAIDEALDYVNDHDKPLALYYFGENKKNQDYVLENTLSGGVTINDTLYHLPQPNLPFGGVGPSGMGHYHGHFGFLEFSKQKPVFIQSRLSFLDLLTPPYGRIMNTALRILVGFRSNAAKVKVANAPKMVKEKRNQ
ncbi:MAG: coniferyl aldehyde dehydrogenase [Gammaproteobacteria bacterium]|nr:coniferyl aldehyde dehydrogenase [Gammaproteobacteria bacterium]